MAGSARALVAALSCVAGMMLAVPTTASAGSFSVRCALAKRASDDPIVHPHHEGASHRHDFYGSRAVSAHADAESMRAGRTSCGDSADTAGYWHPMLRVRGRARRGVLTAYYSRGGKPTVDPFPQGLKIVAGNPEATARQSTRIVWWSCQRPGHESARATRHSRPPRCRRGRRLAAAVAFPDCWNGWTLDSEDHRSHLTYSRSGRCPTSHPAPLPRLVVQIIWPTRPKRAAQVSLASGSWLTMHADFWNTWHQAPLRRLTRTCLNENRDCGLIER